MAAMKPKDMSATRTFKRVESVMPTSRQTMLA